MARVYRPAHGYRPLVFGPIGGLVAAALALVPLVGLTVVRGGTPTTALNAVGAWLVRWLQSADASALDGVYPDATAAGVLVFLLVGALVGALFAALLDRLPEDQPVSWGGLLGLGLWALTRGVIAPALDPVLARAVPSSVLLATDLVFGVLLGAWVYAGRVVRRASGI
jgi:hypothetical protein